MDIQLVLEISAIATIISAGISYITFRKSSSLTYVTQERKEWREAIRRIAEELEKCSYEKRKKVLVQLKTRINAYGLNSKNELNDVHIWKQIQKIEACKEEEYDDLKNQLILYLSLLLKYDWERSKKEVHGEPWKIVGNMFAIAALIFLEIGLYQLSNNAVPGLEMALLLLGVVLVLSKAKKEAGKISRIKCCCILCCRWDVCYFWLLLIALRRSMFCNNRILRWQLLRPTLRPLYRS